MHADENAVILLVEDNPDDEELTRIALDESKVANPLIVVHDGEEALDYLFCRKKFAGRAPPLNPAMMLLDLKLPKVDGLEVLRQMRESEKLSIIPTVILTTSKEERDLIESYRLGANSYIRKPVDFGQFAAAVKQISLYWLELNECPPIERNSL